MHSKQTVELLDAVNKFSASDGEAISLLVEKKSELLISWLQYLSQFHRTGTADSLLEASAASIREAAGLLSLGLARPALFSLRSQVDLLLAWIFFKDHEVEWGHVNQTAEGFKLKKELLSYLENHVLGFGPRMGILRGNSTRTEVDPYRLLSAHIHSQNALVLPAVIDYKDLVRSKAICEECALVAFEVAEYLNDILVCVFFKNWASLPKFVKDAAIARFRTPEEQRAFFS